MGNRQVSATSVPAPPQPSVFAPVPPDSPPSQSSKLEDAVPDEYERNPGNMEQLHKKAKDVFPEPFEGAKFVMNKGLSQNFQVSHSLAMSNVEESGYKFSATYVGHTKYSETDMSPILLGEIYPNGQMSGQAIYMPSQWCRLKLITQIQNRRAIASQFSGEWRGRLSNVGFTAANVDLVSDKGTYVLDIMRAVGSRHSLGSMLVVQRSPQIPGGVMAMCSIGGKLVGDKWELSGSTSPLQMQLNTFYRHSINENFHVAAEFETDYRQQNSHAALAYQYDLTKANVTFKAQMDSNWCVSGVLEKKFTPYPFTFSLCGMANHKKSLYRFGIGLMVG